jgi:hypothetical protein
MTVYEWLDQKYERRVTFSDNPLKSHEQYAEYYHAEKMKQLGNDAVEDIAKEIRQIIGDEHTYDAATNLIMNVINSYIQRVQMEQSKPSDAVEFAEYAFNRVTGQTPISKYMQQLYSQFQNRDK